MRPELRREAVRIAAGVAFNVEDGDVGLFIEEYDAQMVRLATPEAAPEEGLVTPIEDAPSGLDEFGNPLWAATPAPTTEHNHATSRTPPPRSVQSVCPACIENNANRRRMDATPAPTTEEPER